MNSLILASFGSIMMNVLYVIIAIVVLLTMVLIHELGHYIVGRKLGFKITEFSIGFGKALWQKTNKRGELISFRVFPLGGYCAFYGETDDEEPQKEEEKQVDVPASEKAEKEIEKLEKNKENIEEKHKLNEKGRVIYDESEGKFNDMRPWKRILVFLAGVTFNFISAFIFSIIFLCVGGYAGYTISPANIGKTNEVYQVRYTYTDEQGTQQEGFLNDLTADGNGVKVIAINGTKVNYARQNVFSTLVDQDDESITFTIVLNGAEQDIIIKNNEHLNEDGDKIFGFQYSNLRNGYDFGDVLVDFIPFTFEVSVLILKAFWMIITGQVALNQLGGPISTVSQMTQVASLGLANFLYLLPLLAANLAIFNILPIPGLDGSHVIFTLIEWIRGKPIKRDVENAIHTWGVILLFAFVIIIDIVHLLTV